MDFSRRGRPIHSCTNDYGLSERVLYSETAPDSYKSYLIITGFLTCNPCQIAESEDLQKSTYITVYENKIETNNPYVCWCYATDCTNVHYFDRDEFLEMDKSGCCFPICTHNCCCPTLFDNFGEELILHGAPLCSKFKNQKSTCKYPLCICRDFTSLYPLRDAEEVKQLIIEARSNANTMLQMNRRNQSSPHSPHSPRYSISATSSTKVFSTTLQSDIPVAHIASAKNEQHIPTIPTAPGGEDMTRL